MAGAAAACDYDEGEDEERKGRSDHAHSARKSGRLHASGEI
jgi:hypothetical protein